MAYVRKHDSQKVSTAGATISLTVGAVVAVDNRLVAELINPSATAGLTVIVTDPRGNTWTVDQVRKHAGTSIYNAVVSTIASTPYQVGDVIVFHWQSGGSDFSINQRTGTLHEYSGHDGVASPQASFLDGPGSTSTTWSAGSITPTTGQYDIVGAVAINPQGITSSPAAGWTEREDFDGTTRKLVFQDQCGVPGDGATAYSGGGTFDAGASDTRHVGIIVAYALADEPTHVGPFDGELAMVGDVVAEWTQIGHYIYVNGTWEAPTEHVRVGGAWETPTRKTRVGGAWQ